MNRFTKIALKNWKLLLVWNVALVGLTAVNMKLTPQEWTSQAELILPKETSNLDVDLGKLGNLRQGGVEFSQQLNPLKILSSIATSDQVMQMVWEADPERENFKELSNFKKLFEVAPESESTVISISVRGSSRELARQRSQTLITKFRERLQELRRDEATQRSEFMQREVEQAYTKLMLSQRALSRFQESANLVNSEAQTQELITNISTLETMQTQALAEAQASNQQVQIISQRLRMSPQVAIQSSRLAENKEYQYTRQKLSEIETNLSQLRTQFTEDHPKVQNLVSLRDTLRRLQAQYIQDSSDKVLGVDKNVGENSANLIQQLALAESQAGAMQKKAEQLQTKITQLQANLKALPAKKSRLQELQRQYEITEGVYNGVVAQAQQAKLSTFSAYPSVQILDKPTADINPSSPKLRLMVLGAILAALLGSAAIILLAESRNPSLAPKDIQDTKLPILATIANSKNLTAYLNAEMSEEIELQRLASAVSLMRLDNQRILIASATQAEGKTTITLGLAVALTNLGFKVLVVDGDFRRATLSTDLGIENNQDSTRWEDHWRAINVRPGLDVLPMAPENNRISEFVARGEFERNLNFAQAAGNYDYVLVDSAPVGMTSETALMATVVPNVLFVVSPGNSQRTLFHKSMEHLQRHQGNILGLVLNNMETRSEGQLYGKTTTEIEA